MATNTDHRQEALRRLNITYRRSRRARYLRITISPTAAVTVTVPPSATLKQAEAFLKSKEDWIRKHLGRMREKEEQRQTQPEISQEELNKAQDRLFARLEHFSEKHELPFRKAAFRCQKTRWGSCSNKNNISLNINLVFLPDHLQDYVLLHELCHIRHKNHSKAFWSQLDEYCEGRARQWARKLKKQPLKLRI